MALLSLCLSPFLGRRSACLQGWPLPARGKGAQGGETPQAWSDPEPHPPPGQVGSFRQRGEGGHTAAWVTKAPAALLLGGTGMGKSQTENSLLSDTINKNLITFVTLIGKKLIKFNQVLNS